jgi:hypothetical protein
LIGHPIVAYDPAMRSIAVLSLALCLGACTATPVYQDPPLVAKIDRLRVARDNCLLAQAAQLDNGTSDVRRLSREIALACTAETTRLLALAVPYADAQAREGFQDEAARRAADIVVSFRKVDTRSDERRQGEPTPLVR